MDETRAKWLERVAAWQASGQSMGEYCNGQPYKPITLRRWERTFRLNRPSATSTCDTPHVPMVRLMATRLERESSLSIELDDVRIVVRRGVDAELVSQVVRAVRRGR